MSKLRRWIRRDYLASFGTSKSFGERQFVRNTRRWLRLSHGYHPLHHRITGRATLAADPLTVGHNNPTWLLRKSFWIWPLER